MILEHFPEWRRRCDFTKERGLVDPQEEKGDLSPAEQWRGSSEKAGSGVAVLVEGPEDGNFGAGEEHPRGVPVDEVGGTYGPPREQPPHWDQPFQIQGNLCLTSSSDRVHPTPPMGGGLGRSPGAPLTGPAGGSMAAPGQPWGLREDLTEWRAAWGLSSPGWREGGRHPPRSPLWIWLKTKVHLSKFERSVGFIQRFLNLADTKEFRGAVKNERLFEAEGSRTRRLSMV